MSLEPNKCFSGNCKFAVQGSNCMHCSHKNAIIFKKINKSCEVCGRLVDSELLGCGNCMGRGHYIYPIAYEDCDCDGYEKRVN